MSQQNNIAIQIPADALARVNAFIAQLKAELDPYLISLSFDQIRMLAKMGDSTVALVEKTDGYMTSNPEFVPAFLNVDDFKVDFNAVKQLSGIAKTLAQINDNLNDTLTLSGSEAYIAALIYYNSVKQAAKAGIPGAKTIYDDLSARFPGRGNNPKPVQP